MLNIDFEGLCPFVNYISKVRINYIDATFEWVRGSYFCEYKASGLCEFDCPIYADAPHNFHK